MTTELKSYCVNCGGPLEFPAELQGEKIVCPHCSKLTTLGNPKPAATITPAPVFHPGLYQKQSATIKKKSELIGLGCVVQLIGVCLLFLFPIGTLIGIVLLVIGGRLAIKLSCSNCGNVIASKQVKECPSCHASF